MAEDSHESRSWRGSKTLVIFTATLGLFTGTTATFQTEHVARIVC
jgi:hypothetical protein